MSLDLNQISTSSSSKSKESSGSIMELLNRDIQFTKPKLSDKKKERFYHELYSLLSSGLDIKTAMEMIQDRASKKKERSVYENISHKLLKGESLSEAMESEKVFSLYESRSVAIGEESGKVEEVLNDLASYFAKKAKQRSQLISTLTYPIIVILFSLGAVFFLVKFVVPMFAELFQRFGGELPGITKTVIALSENADVIGLTIIVSVAGIYISHIILKKNTGYLNFHSKLLMSLPVFGSVIKKSYQARFCQSMALLMNARVPLDKSLLMVEEMISFYPLQKALTDIQGEIVKGTPLSFAMSKHKIFDKKMISMIRVGEEINQLGPFFSKLAGQISDDLEHKSKTIGKVMEPFIILFLATVVAFVLLAMYIPLFDLGSLVH